MFSKNHFTLSIISLVLIFTLTACSVQSNKPTPTNNETFDSDITAPSVTVDNESKDIPDVSEPTAPDVSTPNTEPTDPVSPTEPTMPIPPTDPIATEPSEDNPTEPQTETPTPSEPTELMHTMTYLEYYALSAQEQQAFIDSFPTLDDFFAWHTAAKKAYEEERTPIDQM